MNVFQDPTKSIPKSDPQIVRVSMMENEIGGRKDHMPARSPSSEMSVKHISPVGSKS